MKNLIEMLMECQLRVIDWRSIVNAFSAIDPKKRAPGLYTVCVFGCKENDIFYTLHTVISCILGHLVHI